MGQERLFAGGVYISVVAILSVACILSISCRDDATSDMNKDGGADSAFDDWNDNDTTPDDTPHTAGASSCSDSGADDGFSFFVTSWYHMQLLSGSSDGFGGDLRFDGASTGLAGADAICQEIASQVCFGHLTWRAFLSSSQEDAIDRIGDGPWYDWSGALVAENTSGLVGVDRPAGGCCNQGMFDELGAFHDGTTDANNDGQNDDDHDVLTASNEQGRYNGFSCDDWTSTTTSSGGRSSGPMCGHSWPAQSGQSWIAAHSAGGCATEVNFSQDGRGTGDGVGSGGGYGAIYCFAK